MIGTGELTAAIRIAHLMQLCSNTELELDRPRARETRDELLSWNSNLLLSDGEQHRIRAFIIDARQNLDVIDGEIFRVWQQRCDGPTVEMLLEQREEEARRLKIMQIGICPLKRIPPEILGSIFLWYVEGKVVLPPKHISNPWKLGHVSSHWRRVLWSTPVLWNNLEIALPLGLGDDVDVVGNLTLIRGALNDILSRGSWLLDLRVLSHSITPIADLIQPFGHRFKSLSIKNISYGIFHSLVKLPPGALPFLETLTLDIYYNPDSLARILPVSSLQAAPGLKDVNLSFRPTKTPAIEYVDSSPPYLPSLPWSQLHQLVLISEGVPWTMVQHIFAQCASLSFCRITVCQVSDATTISSKCVLANLETLQLTQVGTLEWDKFLGPFRFPSLLNLAINPGTSESVLYPMVSLGAITSLVLRSMCCLESFSIGGNMDSTKNCYLPSIIIPNVDDLFQASPRLKILEGTLVVPASIFIAMKNGRLHLPKLHLVVIRVQPDGLQAFVELLNSFIRFEGESRVPTYSGSIRRASITCWAGQGYKDALKAYTDSFWLYEAAGIYTFLECISGEEGNE